MKGAAVDHNYGSAPSGIMEAPYVVLPEAKLFSKRATRLRELVAQVPRSWDVWSKPSTRY